MSDPVTNVEIEDVLSSIRRLVSEDFRDEVAAKPTPEQAVATATRPTDALILTPDHRVDDSPRSVAAEQSPQLRTTARAELERAIAELEAMVSTDAPDGHAAVATPAPIYDGPKQQTVADALGHPEEETDDLDWDAPVGTAIDGSPPEQDHGSDQDALAEAADAEVDEEFQEPEAAEPAAQQADDALDEIQDKAAEAEAPEEPVASEDHANEQAASIDEDSEDAAPIDVSSLDLSDIIAEAAAEELVEQVSDEVDEQPQEADFDQDAQEIVEDAQVVTDFPNARAHIAATFEQSVDDDQADDTLGGAPYEPEFADPYPSFDTLDHSAPDADMTIDEDVLRDMVADIVRAELQGELGERITRNVRKLVRREINRALAGQDLI